MKLTESQFTNTMSRISASNPEALSIAGADSAIIGIISRCGQPELLCYDFELLLEHFLSTGMNFEDAREWVETQCLGA